MHGNVRSVPSDSSHAPYVSYTCARRLCSRGLLPVAVLQEVEEKLQAELAEGLASCVAEVDAFMAPLEAAADAAVEKVRQAEARRAELAGELEGLKQRAASVE